MHVLEIMHGNDTTQIKPRGRGHDSMVPLWFGDKMFSTSIEDDINSDFKETSEIDSNKDSIRRVCDGAKRQGQDIRVKAIAITPWGDKEYKSPVRIATDKLKIDDLVKQVVAECVSAIKALHDKMAAERKAA